MKVRFWLVWNPVAGPPTFRHTSRASACREAERLAMNNPGETFIVLESVAECCVRVRREWEEHATDGNLPF